jgi:glycosyltransferase involved in cell wall biosynthesis
MRIFMLVQQQGPPGPVPKLTAHLVAALRSRGCTIVTHPWGRRRHAESLSEKVRERIRQVLSVRRALEDQAFDVAVVTTAHDWRTLVRDISVVFVIRRRCRPVVLQLHGSRASRLIGRGHYTFKFATAALLSLVDGLFVLSNEERRQWQAFRSRPPVFTVKNPYVRTFSSDSREAAPTSAPHNRALFVGRLIEEKGIFDLIDAMPLVLENTECNLVVVGEGDQELELRDRIRRLGLGDRVTITGYLSGPELSDAYRGATIFVFPTKWDEGFPTVLAEAMDAGLPIVTTRIRGAADYLVAGENALFIEPRDVKGLAAAMTTLLLDGGFSARMGSTRARMGSANRERIQVFDPAVVAAEYLDVLTTIVRAFRS